MSSAITIWKGVLIEESLTDTAILTEIKIIETKVTMLEGEDFKGQFHFHNVEVEDERLDDVIQFVLTHLRDASWYFHLIKADKMIVMFQNKVFKAHKGNAEEIEKIRQYGISQGILKEQLGLERLFDNPFD